MAQINGRLGRIGLIGKYVADRERRSRVGISAEPNGRLGRINRLI